MAIVSAPYLAVRTCGWRYRVKRHGNPSRPSSSPGAAKRTRQAEVTYCISTSFS